ncbi:MAG TPA: S9 family peptidase [Thermoanaerobaculia bacterium]|nr:S9 family peptidase [Thermoanaerobaculia bacterium]
MPVKRTLVTVALAALACPLPAARGSAQQGFEPRSGDDFEGVRPWQVAITRTVTGAVFSPDGSQIAYTLAVPRRPLAEDSGTSWVELHVMFEDGESVPYVIGQERVSDVAWRRAGEITFLAKREGDEHESLYSIATRGGEARKLLEHDTAISTYSWSPDGARVAFLAKEDLDELQPSREELREKGFDQKIYEEDVAFTRLFVAEVGDGSLAAGAEAPEPEQLPVKGSVRAVEWSPEGDLLMITDTPTPLIDDSYTRIKVRLLDVEGDLVRTVENPGKLGDVRLSPDGRHLAMISAADLNDPAAGRLMVAETGAGALRDLLPGLPGHVSSLAWVDGDTIAYTADVGTETEIGLVDLAGSKRVLVPPGRIVTTRLEVSPGGDRAALLGETPTHPQELFTLDLGDGKLAAGALVRRTESNPWLEEVRLARQETITFEARDGLELQGILMVPLEHREGERHPLIMVVHGGPESHYRNGWLTGYSTSGQHAAARGFAVFYPNYRGSTGRGVEFSKTSQAEATNEEFDDVIDGVDHLIEIGLADRDRIGITGGSYGGYASAWGATYYSERFAAAIPFVGISNAISKVGTTDIPQEMFDVHHRKWLWEDWDYFEKASPIRYVERNRTPTLILHGEDDPRVHPSQSMELYRHLEVLGQAPVRLVFYPGEGHGNTKSAARFDYMLRTLRWMEHYLGGSQPGKAAGEPPPMEIDYAEWLPWPADDETDEDQEEQDETTESRQ